ncbi:hypothetical protein [Kitasatospora sp. NPDC008115]|uniref:hypothetical protein n=1 Tax=Kitasatospora sp. NPDC008115 TaxID=3364022 RepID=UPI0036E2FE20
MDTTPTSADVRDQHIADLRAALQRAIPMLAYSAGREAADNPGYSAQLLEVTEVLNSTLDRTAP